MSPTCEIQSKFLSSNYGKGASPPVETAPRATDTPTKEGENRKLRVRKDLKTLLIYIQREYIFKKRKRKPHKEGQQKQCSEEEEGHSPAWSSSKSRFGERTDREQL